MTDGIVLHIAKKESHALQHALSRSPYNVSLETMVRRNTNDIAQWAADYSPGQIAGPLRSALKHCDDIRKILNVA